MKQTEQYINVQGRDVIISKNLKDVVQENDINSEKVKITMDRFYDGEDFDAKQVNLYIRTPIYEEIIVDLNTVKTAEEDKLVFDFIFTEEMTKDRGWLDIVFVVTGSDYKWQSKQANRAVFVGGNFLSHKQPVPPQYFVDLEAYRQEILSYVSQSREYSELAANEVVKAEIEVEKAKVEVELAKEEVVKAKNEADRAGSAAEDAVSGAYEYINNMVTLNNDSQSNFNFNVRKVEQDGLVTLPYKIKDTNENKITFICTFVYRGPIAFLNHLQSGDASGWNLTTASNNTLRLGLVLTAGTYTPFAGKTRLVVGERYELYCTKHGDSYKVFLNGNLEINITASSVYSDLNYTSSSTALEKQIFYNRLLTPQEIQHDFQVLDNSESIDSISITDKDGASKNFILSTDSYHTTMANGFNLEQFATSVMKRDAQTFTSVDGSPIEINNGMEYGKILKGEIQGQTVKNIAPTQAIQTIQGDGTAYVGKTTNIKDTPQIKPNTEYTIVTIVYENSLNANFISLHGGYSTNAFQSPSSYIEKKKTGVFYQTAITKTDFNGITSSLKTSTSVSTETGMIKYQQMLFEGRLNSTVNSYIPFGLSSTQAIINNNGQSYPIYEPTIQGKTRILKALKGTQNWVEIDAGEARDTTQFDYKLESLKPIGTAEEIDGLMDLGSASSVSDVVYRENGRYEINTKEIVLDGSQEIIKSTRPDWNIFYFSRILCSKAESGKIKIISNTIKSIDRRDYLNNFYPNTLLSLTEDTGAISIQIDSSIASTVEQLKTWLQTNPITVRYQLATPQEIQLTDEEFKVYDKHKKLISLGGVGEFADSIQINSDGSATYADNMKRVILTGDESITLVNTDSENTTRFNMLTPDGKKGLTIDKLKVKSNIMPEVIGWNLYSEDREGVTLYASNGGVFARLLKSTVGENAESIKAYFKSMYDAGTPVVIEYPIESPIITHIPKEIMTTIPVNKINNLSVGNGVNPSSFKVVAPVDQVSALWNELNRLSAIIDTPANTQLLKNHIDDEYLKSKERI